MIRNQIILERYQLLVGKACTLHKNFLQNLLWIKNIYVLKSYTEFHVYLFNAIFYHVSTLQINFGDFIILANEDSSLINQAKEKNNSLHNRSNTPTWQVAAYMVNLVSVLPLAFRARTISVWLIHQDLHTTAFTMTLLPWLFLLVVKSQMLKINNIYTFPIPYNIISISLLQILNTHML